LKDFVCGVGLLDEMMDEVMMMCEVMVGEVVVVVAVLKLAGVQLRFRLHSHDEKTP
tara:strand:+ start:63 stop:230 length:168 start_codon:yes stop_codon:yes gene_type:complete